MKTFDRVPLSCDMIEKEIQDRDYAIMELWHTLEGVVGTAYNPILDKYSDFVDRSKEVYARTNYVKRIV